MKEKMKWIPLVVKTSHRLNSQLGPVAPVALLQFRIDPYGSQFFCFRARFQTLFVHCFPNQYPRSSKSCKVAPYMKKSRPRLKSHSPTRAIPGEPTFATFPYRNLAFNYTKKQIVGSDRALKLSFFDGKVTFLAKSTFLQVNTWLDQPAQLG